MLKNIELHPILLILIEEEGIELKRALCYVL
jgi:hypothetical protein